MLAALHRFHGHGSLRYVYQYGTAQRCRLLTVKSVTNPRRRHSRFSVVVSKKVHKGAVGRNRIRRRLYALVHEELDRLTRVHDVAIIVTSSEVMTAEPAELSLIVRDMFEKSGLYQ